MSSLPRDLRQWDEQVLGVVIGLVILVVGGGVALGLYVGVVDSLLWALAGGIVGAFAAFLVVSYWLYGR